MAVIAAVQRRDRADYRANVGGELTLDAWITEYGESGIRELCSFAARQAGLGEHAGDLVQRIIGDTVLRTTAEAERRNVAEGWNLYRP
ncbi:hypothetical protein H9Y04_43400 [Streptomyces sp. TRM66268-LWL]|uniref:Uncharacterized protein n=1 Tax=Streptomyces polyasparticus TaxID=2767826 RepID=A0ABR7SYN6_9ACTN|nr:hypothetical protein [Streptomyces polyasparticus]MBC9719378.1 hypothetical protein [Streptomyces polyasparticus]